TQNSHFGNHPASQGLHRRDEGTIARDVAVSHAGSVEGKTEVALAVEEDGAAGAVRSLGEQVDGFAGGEIGAGGSTRNIGGRVHANGRTAKKIYGRFGQYNFHDGFAVAGAGNAAGFGVRVAAA